MSARILLYRTLAVALGLLFVVFTSEIVLRGMGYRPSLINPNLFVAGDDDLLPYKLQPGFDGYYIGKRVTIDAAGHRVVAAPAAGDDVFLLLGDSVVFGHGIDDHHTLAATLQSSFYRQGLAYRVENVAAPGYTSWNEYAALMEYFKHRTAEVVVAVFIPNDVTFENDHLGLRHGEFKILAQSRFHLWARVLYEKLYTAFLLRDGLRVMTARLRPEGEDAMERYLDREAMTYAAKALVAIDAECTRRDVRFLVAVYRDHWHHTDPETSKRYEDMVMTALAERGIPSFLLKSHLEELSLREARVHWNDRHPSPTAIALMARDIMDEIGSSAPRIGDAGVLP